MEPEEPTSGDGTQVGAGAGAGGTRQITETPLVVLLAGAVRPKRIELPCSTAVKPETKNTAGTTGASVTVTTKFEW